MGCVGRKPIPAGERRIFVSVGLAPELHRALQSWQRKMGISNTAEAARMSIIRTLEREQIYDPDPPPAPRRKR